MTTLKERILSLASTTEHMVKGWKLVQWKNPERRKTWTSFVTLGRWTLAQVRLYEDREGELTVSVRALSVPLEGDVQEESSDGKTVPGHLSLDAAEAVELLRNCAGQAEGIALSMLEWACKGLLESGVGAERVLAAAQKAVVTNVMES